MNQAWWKEIFDDRYLKTYVDIITPEATTRQVKFILQKLQLDQQDQLLDLACGYGRHSIMLAKHVGSVTGLDFSGKFIDLAKSEASRRKISNLNFILGDMRQFNFKNKFDAVISMFTSFGYFNDEENFSVLNKISHALKEKGKLLLDINNPFFIVQTIMESRDPSSPDRFRSVRGNVLSNGLEVEISNEFDPVSMRWRLERKWLEGGRQESSRSNIRLYTAAEFEFLLELAGLRLVKLWGDFGDEPFALMSPRLIVLARKD